jgi:hypothetical protein
MGQESTAGLVGRTERRREYLPGENYACHRSCLGAGKTGYLMMDKSWDLGFAGMITAHQLVISGKASLENFQKTVIVYSEHNGWLVWPVHNSTQEVMRREGRR